VGDFLLPVLLRMSVGHTSLLSTGHSWVLSCGDSSQMLDSHLVLRSKTAWTFTALPSVHISGESVT
jgi:hypothetical protein